MFEHYCKVLCCVMIGRYLSWELVEYFLGELQFACALSELIPRKFDLHSRSYISGAKIDQFANTRKHLVVRILRTWENQRDSTPSALKVAIDFSTIVLQTPSQRPSVRPISVIFLLALVYLSNVFGFRCFWATPFFAVFEFMVVASKV